MLIINSYYSISPFFLQTSYEKSKPELVCRALEVVGAYIAWIDIGLIANERFVPVLIRFMSDPLLQESASDCIYEIISKGMEPRGKMELIESFMNVFQSASVFDVTDVSCIVAISI